MYPCWDKNGDIVQYKLNPNKIAKVGKKQIKSGIILMKKEIC